MKTTPSPIFLYTLGCSKVGGDALHPPDRIVRFVVSYDLIITTIRSKASQKQDQNTGTHHIVVDHEDFVSFRYTTPVTAVVLVSLSTIPLLLLKHEQCPTEHIFKIVPVFIS